MLFLFVLYSCSYRRDDIQTEMGLGDFDSLYAEYPSKRIKPGINKICILGNNDGVEKDDFLQALFIKLFESMELEIEIVESGSAKSLLDSEMIFRNFKIERWKSEKLANLLQIDHVFICKETSFSRIKTSNNPYYSYIIDLKIVDTRNGIVSYQDRKQYGVDINNSNESISEETLRQIISKLRFNCYYSLVYSLYYAFGDVHPGILFESNVSKSVPVVSGVVLYSPAYNAGIKIGDKILKINDVSISNPFEFRSVFEKTRPDQGGSTTVTVKRNKQIIDCKLNFPYIEKQDLGKNKGRKQKEAGPRI